MKNRFFTFLISVCVISILIAGCTADDKSNEQRKYGFQPPIDKLDWGMSLDDIEKTLDIQNGVDGVFYNYEDPITTITLKDKIKEFGYNATVSLEIYDKPKEEWYPYKSSYLAYVRLTYDKIDGEKIKDNIIKTYNNSGKDWTDLLNNNCTTWLSSDKIKDISPNIKQDLEDYWKLLSENSTNTNSTSLLLTKSNDEYINNIVLVYSKNGAVLTFSGDTAVQLNQIITHK